MRPAIGSGSGICVAAELSAHNGRAISARGGVCAGGEHGSKVFEKAADGPRQWLKPGGWLQNLGGKARAAGLGGVASFVPGAAGFMLVSATFRHRLCPTVNAGCRRSRSVWYAAARAGKRPT
jgi:hypothetical protein